MSTHPPGFRESTGSGSGVHRHGLPDDETIGHKLANCLTRVGIADLVDLVRIQPDFALATAHHRRGEALLSPEVDPVRWMRSASMSFTEQDDAMHGFSEPTRR